MPIAATAPVKSFDAMATSLSDSGLAVGDGLPASFACRGYMRRVGATSGKSVYNFATCTPVKEAGMMVSERTAGPVTVLDVEGAITYAEGADRLRDKV